MFCTVCCENSARTGAVGARGGLPRGTAQHLLLRWGERGLVCWLGVVWWLHPYFVLLASRAHKCPPRCFWLRRGSGRPPGRLWVWVWAVSGGAATLLERLTSHGDSCKHLSILVTYSRFLIDHAAALYMMFFPGFYHNNDF